MMRNPDPQWTPVLLRNINGTVKGFRYVDNTDDSPLIVVDGRRLYQHTWERLYGYQVEEANRG